MGSWMTDRDTLIEQLMRQRTLLGKLEALGDRQDQLVESEQTEALLALLAERQQIVDDIVELGRRLDQELGDVAEHPDEAVQALRSQIEAAAGRIAARDEANRRTLDTRRRALSAEMAGVGRGRTAMAAYSTRERAARFKDTEA